MLNKLFVFFKSYYRLAVLLSIMLIIYFYKLSRYPLIFLDEPWLSESSWNFLTLGKFVNLTFTDFFNKDLLDLIFPVYNFLLVLVFKIFGLKIIAARGLSVVLGFFTLIFVYLTVKQLYKNENAALAAAAFLMLNPVFFLCSRQARPEAYVTFFAVLSFYFLIKAVDAKKNLYYLICGISSGLAVLSHPTGVFVIISLFLTMMFLKERKTALNYLFGVFVTIFGFICFMLANYNFYKQQIFGQFTGRLFVLDSIFSIILNEYKRWVLLSLRIPVIGSIAALVYLIFSEYKKKVIDEKIKILIIYVIIFMFVLGTLEKSKDLFYVNLIFPFFSMIVAGAFINIYEKRKVLALGLLAFLLLCSSAFIPYKLYKFSGSDYYALISKFKDAIPKGSTVMAQPTYWFGLGQDYTFRTYAMPDYYKVWYKADFKKSIKKAKINYIIFDNYWGGVYNKENYPVDVKEREDFFKNNCVLVKTITDKYYGQESEKKHESNNIKIYRVIKQ